MLLVRHTYGPRAWDLPGGAIKRGEPPIDAARREMDEELGLDDAPLARRRRAARAPSSFRRRHALLLPRGARDSVSSRATSASWRPPAGSPADDAAGRPRTATSTPILTARSGRRRELDPETGRIETAAVQTVVRDSRSSACTYVSLGDRGQRPPACGSTRLDAAGLHFRGLDGPPGGTSGRGTQRVQRRFAYCTPSCGRRARRDVGRETQRGATFAYSPLRRKAGPVRRGSRNTRGATFAYSTPPAEGWPRRDVGRETPRRATFAYSPPLAAERRAGAHTGGRRRRPLKPAGPDAAEGGGRAAALAGGPGGARRRRGRPAPQRPACRGLGARYSHSIVPGGLEVMSSTTRPTGRISLIIREAICSSRS